MRYDNYICVPALIKKSKARAALKKNAAVKSQGGDIFSPWIPCRPGSLRLRRSRFESHSQFRSRVEGKFKHPVWRRRSERGVKRVQGLMLPVLLVLLCLEFSSVRISLACIRNCFSDFSASSHVSRLDVHDNTLSLCHSSTVTRISLNMLQD